MPSVLLKRINGLLLGRTTTQAGEIHVVKGRNFMPFLEGPRSYFGSEPLTNSPFDDTSKYFDVFPNDGDFIYIDENAVYKITEDCYVEKVFDIECRETEREPCDFEYPWSHAYVGDSYFYAHPSVGLIEFDTFTKEWCQHSRVKLGFSDLIFSITKADQSLIVQSRDTVTWSEFDNGTALIENEYSGAGSQSTHLAGRGRPLGVYSDGQGWFTFTDKGVMYSRPLSSAQIISGEDIETSARFRHDEFETDSIPFSPYSITNISKSLILYVGNKGLTQVGRFDNNQFTSKTFSPEMSRWMRECLFNRNDDHLTWGSHRLFFDKSRNWLFMSFSHEITDVFDESLVYDVELQEWGSFNRKHTLVRNFPRNSHSYQHSRLGFLTRNGYINVFNSRGYHVTNYAGALKKEGLDSFIDVGYIRPENSEEDAERQYSLEGFTIETSKCETEFQVEVYGAMGECDYEDECSAVEPFKHSTRNCANYYVCSNLGAAHIVRIIANRINESFWIKLIRLNLKQRGKL